MSQCNNEPQERHQINRGTKYRVITLFRSGERGELKGKSLNEQAPRSSPKSATNTKLFCFVICVQFRQKADFRFKFFLLLLCSLLSWAALFFFLKFCTAWCCTSQFRWNPYKLCARTSIINFPAGKSENSSELIDTVMRGVRVVKTSCHCITSGLNARLNFTSIKQRPYYKYSDNNKCKKAHTHTIITAATANNCACSLRANTRKLLLSQNLVLHLATRMRIRSIMRIDAHWRRRSHKHGCCGNYGDRRREEEKWSVEVTPTNCIRFLENYSTKSDLNST